MLTRLIGRRVLEEHVALICIFHTGQEARLVEKNSAQDDTMLVNFCNFPYYNVFLISLFFT